MQIRAAKESDLAEIIRQQKLVFRPDEPDAGRRYWSYIREEPTYRIDQLRVLEHDGRVVSNLRVWDRQIRVRGATLRAGGIALVLTCPDCRGHGFARALMEQTDQYFAESGYDIGLLFTIIGTEFYGRLGWTLIPLPVFEMELDTNTQVQSVDASVRPLDMRRDLADVMEIYESFTRNMTGPEVRPREYWESGPSRFRGVFPGWGVELEGRIVAYLNLETQSDQLHVREACALPDAQDTYGILLEKVVAEARMNNIIRVTGILPQTHPLVDHFHRAEIGSIRWGTEDEMMVKMINENSFAAKFDRPPLPERLDSESGFFAALFGVEPAALDSSYAEWIDSLPTCDGPIYWLPDIF